MVRKTPCLLLVSSNPVNLDNAPEGNVKLTCFPHVLMVNPDSYCAAVILYNYIYILVQ